MKVSKQEAIDILNEIYCTNDVMDIDQYEMLFDALSEPETEPCEYCADFDPNGSHEVELYWTGHKAEPCDAKYCPNCGRKLIVNE